jgi:hypothetical protein
VATGLWIVSGFVNHSLLVNAGGVPTPVIDLVVPRGMDFRLTSGESGSARSRRSPAFCWRSSSQA